MRERKIDPEQISLQTHKHPSQENWENLHAEKPARLLLARLEKIIRWLNTIKKDFANYQEAKKNFEQWENLNPRLPKSDYITQLQLDISPQLSKALKKFISAKKLYYEAIRSSKKIELGNDERKKIIQQTVQWCRHENQPVPDMETLLFPDLKITRSSEDLKNSKKEIEFDPLASLFTLSLMAADIESRLRTANSKKGNGRPAPSNSFSFYMSHSDGKSTQGQEDPSEEKEGSNPNEYYDEGD